MRSNTGRTFTEAAEENKEIMFKGLTLAILFLQRSFDSPEENVVADPIFDQLQEEFHFTISDDIRRAICTHLNTVNAVRKGVTLGDTYAIAFYMFRALKGGSTIH